ncbi:hypothetical protein TNCV_4279571 [Trichonephila clavipes]|nr:hypothetical protein TNCV_4279571 [Trichonephila clavipes]
MDVSGQALLSSIHLGRKNGEEVTSEGSRSQEVCYLMDNSEDPEIENVIIKKSQFVAPALDGERSQLLFTSSSGREEVFDSGRCETAN